MEIILLEPVNKLGNAGDIVEVKNGYARNFLIPQGKVLRANKENKAEFEARRAEIEKANKAKQEEAEKEQKKIDGKFIVVIRQAGEDGRLFGSVNAKDIAESLESDFDVKVKRNQINLNRPIKSLGIFPEDIVIHGNVIAKVSINVARSADEAKDAEKEFLNPKKKEDSSEK
jgi:large subunit ribosomal protein L9